MSLLLNRWTKHTAVLVAGCALWLATNSYLGIWHDARVYSLMAMRRLLPEAYSSDPWFMFGSQDSYSIFSPIFAAMVSAFGLGDGARIITLIGGFAFSASAYAFSRAALNSTATLCFFLLVTIPLPYCPNHWDLIQVSESFATARPWGIAASLTGLALHLRNHRLAASALYVLGLALHPLMTVGAVALSIAVELRPKVLVAMAISTVIAVLAGILAGIPSLQQMGEPWRTLVAETAGIVFMPGPRHDASLVVAVAAVIMLAFRHGSEQLRKWYATSIIVGGAGYLTTVIASAYWPSALVMQVQPWRALWLPTVFSIVAVADLVSTFQYGSRLARPTLLIAAILILLFERGGGYILFASSVILISVPQLSVRLAEFCSRYNLARALWLVLLVAALTEAPILWHHFDIIGARQNVVSSQVLDVLRGFLDVGGFGLLAVVAWQLIQRLPPASALAITLLLFSLSFQSWDQRPEAVRTQETSYLAVKEAAFFTDHIRQGDTVYWPNNPERVWFDLRTASYASGTQTTGIVFSEGFALEMQRRMARVFQLGLPDSMFNATSDAEYTRFAFVQEELKPTDRNNIRMWERRSSKSNAGVTPGSLAYLCADEALDWVVDVDLGKVAPVATELIPLPGRGRIRHALFDCDAMRSMSGTDTN